MSEEEKKYITDKLDVIAEYLYSENYSPEDNNDIAHMLIRNLILEIKEKPCS